MLFFPRKSRHQCIFVLLLFCFVGVYLTYRQLNEANKSPSRLHRLHNIHKPEPAVQEHVVRQEIKGAPPVIKPLDLDLKQGALGARILENDEDYITPEERENRLRTLLIELSPSNWKTTPDADDVMLRVKSVLMDLDIYSKFSCQEIDRLRVGGTYRQSYYGKKNVEHARVGGYGDELVVKSIGSDQQFKIECMKMDYNPERCVLLTNYKLMRELMLLVTLNSPSIIKLEGFCLRGATIDSQIAKKGVVVITEPGDQIESFTFSTFRWLDKLNMSIKILEMLTYLENNTVGTLGFYKLHLSDFVLVNRKDLKLVDLDNIHIGEMGCVLTTDCTIPEMTRREIPCVQNYCKGRNALNNLLWVYRILLMKLLDLPPFQLRTEVSAYLSSIQVLKVTTREVLNKLNDWYMAETGGKRAVKVPETPKKVVTYAPAHHDNDKFNNNADNRVENRADNNPFGERSDTFMKKSGAEDNGFLDGHREGVLGSNNGEALNNQNNVVPEKAKEPESWRNQKGVYDRYPNSNFAGLFDYKCPETRVSWGCVISVRSLADAKSACDEDPVCQSFVVFSSHPENEALMTMVRKNGANRTPEHNYGATLFVKKKPTRPAKHNDVGVNPPVVTTAKLKISKQKQEQDLNSCLKKAGNQTGPARSAREGRIFTHLGLKGISEHDWKIYALSSKIERHFGPSSLATDQTNGSRFKIQFEKNTLGLKRGEFIFEQGTIHNHIGSLIVYHLDRVLGLYHTPPTIVKKLLLSEINDVKGDTSFVEKFSPFYETVGTSMFIKGLLTVAVPPVMRTEKLNIKSQKTIVAEVLTFSRSQKSHLEYILLWSLSKLMQPQHGYLGYKGHLIHFETDLAFNNLKKSILGYFYNCQFPNTVHKVLMCYKCQDSQKMSKVCGLGEEVMTRVQSSGFTESEIKVNNLAHGELAQVINNGASSILNIVEQCVHVFGRSDVLY